MRPARRDFNQGYPPSSLYGGGQGYPLAGGQMQNGGGMGNPHHQQQQQQQQQQQSMMQQQQMRGGQMQGGQMQGGQQQGPGSDIQSNAPSQSQQPEMNLANVLHYLQSEWRRWERDRNEWEIERAEMRARIAMLEGQRRSAENLKVDLLRRVKMLEHALRQERAHKAGGRATAGAARLLVLQDEDKMSRDDKEGSGSSDGGDDNSERPERPPKANGTHASGMAKAASTAHRPVPDTSAWKNLAAPPRDPKARARSREYLKQCLQEITYLTSPGALNPLPARAPVSIDESNGEAGVPERPRKTLPEQPIPSMVVNEPEAKSEQPAAPSASASGAAPVEPTGPTSQAISEAAAAATATTVQEAVANTTNREQTASSVPNGSAEGNETRESSAATIGDAPPSSPAPRTVALPENETPAGGSPPGLSVIEPPRQQLTAIYKPESKAAWREELRAANEAASKVPWPPRKTTDEEQLAGLTLIDEDIKAEEADGDRVWTTRRALKSHLDIVRSVALANGPDLILATGGDDCTVKVWALDAPSVMSSTYRPLAASEQEPAATYRGHTEPVLAVAVSSTLGLVFSASADSTIRVWELASRGNDPYAPYDPSKAVATLEGHTEAVWDVCLIPARPSANGTHGTKPGAESQLVSVSSDGTAKLWMEKDGRWSLQASFTDFGGATPTCVSGDNQDFGRVLVGLSNGLVKLYSLEDGSVVQEFGEEGSQVNAILSHPTLPLVVTGHEDGHLRFFDSKTGAQNSSLLAHPKPITSLSLSPLSPTCVLSASVDCSVRLWDLQRKTSLQDLNGHRQRSNEGVTHVASHPEMPIIASAGADGVVRIWGAG
ncbi:WD40 repeat-like protein [Cutaneotrichosporon oleaginosum]|uniref:WD40 repeat-like protein n=1 Tax=Cutaneotrichosporon oleaginosum TaxID=879819 RepID=A0A0J0XI85_9TREE|nr:WD40 repeat-like protein [Cutaneotrichosporon oleaginosum]KLT40793.1 WD40 repeat-like protein [Cutaneotrichosporon oleaginosum]TXT11895.1 hypothetical protein COLE_02305 [Cutaneotrichosporon oleaginosum]